MARWLLYCPDCKQEFTHAETHSEKPPYSWFDAKPEFPEGGLNTVCPNCNKSAVYQRHELYYRAN